MAQTATGRSYAAAVHPSWVGPLAPAADQIAELGDMLREEIASGGSYLPAGTNVLRAFSYPFDDVKVLIVGQDPFPTRGPASLRNIFKELADDVGEANAEDGDLTGWASQGVCLLNRVLTVRPGAPGSHRGRGWEHVTETAIRALSSRGSPLVSILWGRDAQNLRPLLGDTPVLSAPHPSPLSAYRGFFGSKPFSQANELLQQAGAAPINWLQTSSVS
mgnify:CR=1 FL=1